MNRVAMAGAVGVVCIAGTGARAEIVIVHVFNWEYSIHPQGQPIIDAVISIGDTIRFQFDDSGHTATSVTGIPEVFNLSGTAGQFRDHTFTNVGVWHYYCIPHGSDNGNGTASGMAGTVTVLVPAPAGAAIIGAGALCAVRRQR